MASNHTQHYNLSQWEATDAVVRRDFNEDHAKIDTALAGKLGRSQEICTLSVNPVSNSFIFDISSVDWDEWETVFMVFDRGTEARTDPAIIACQGYNGNQQLDNYSTADVNSIARAETNSSLMLLVFFPRHDASRTVSVSSFSGNSAYGVCAEPFYLLNRLRFLHIRSGYGAGGTATLKIWGVK